MNVKKTKSSKKIVLKITMSMTISILFGFDRDVHKGITDIDNTANDLY